MGRLGSTSDCGGECMYHLL